MSNISSTNPAIVIIDYNMGNLFSVQQAFLYHGFQTKITTNKRDVIEADCIILPGVGAFGDAMGTLQKLDLVEPILNHIVAGKPFFGICLGLQLLFKTSHEFGVHEGLGVIPGVVSKFPNTNENGEKNKIPQINWNKIYNYENTNWEKSPLVCCEKNDFMYFVHSYYVTPLNQELVCSFTEYGGIEYCSSILKDNIFACQFHPEKSGSNGLNIIKTFLNQYYGK